ncbi:transmembrane protein 25 isoform X4 [Aquila chrysaetos chrysaetos]|uniref:transmembrane protein 25 isoform X4 n=1 Tax=Aquila chrysaetos chrysaetos TaxID=223781 RepID=UPI0011772294|nr:transmembrane protein 25 isoform X4 [Aquila chrysaetos chrysaetos]
MLGPACRGPGAEPHCGLGWTRQQRCSSAERSQHTMGRPRGWPGAALACRLLLLGLPVLCSAGLGELGPTIDGQPLAVCTLLEEESHAFTCRAPRPAPGATLAWYLDGRKQEANCSAAGTASTLTLTARRTDRELNCSLTDPASGETYNASVLLDVQYKPEILRADARYQEVEGAGLLLVLFVLVQANPPASITWIDQDGRVMANASEFLLLGATRYPGLANHSLRIHLSRAAGNISVSAANSVGITTTSLLPPAPSTRSPGARACPARPGPCHLTCALVTSRSRPELPPRMQEPVPGERRARCRGQRTSWSSASSVLSSSRCPGASTKCPA